MTAPTAARRGRVRCSAPQRAAEQPFARAGVRLMWVPRVGELVDDDPRRGQHLRQVRARRAPRKWLTPAGQPAVHPSPLAPETRRRPGIAFHRRGNDARRCAQMDLQVAAQPGHSSQRQVHQQAFGDHDRARVAGEAGRPDTLQCAGQALRCQVGGVQRQPRRADAARPQRRRPHGDRAGTVDFKHPQRWMPGGHTWPQRVEPRAKYQQLPRTGRHFALTQRQMRRLRQA